jgi:HSP20 family protein
MHELVELRGKIGRLFDELLSRVEPHEVQGSGEWTPKVDLYEFPDRIVLRADVPGVPPETLDLRIEAGYLLLRGTRHQPHDLDPAALSRVERPFGGFARRWALPDGIDPDGVRASCLHGVLEITLRKREVDVPRRIAVQQD